MAGRVVLGRRAAGPLLSLAAVLLAAGCDRIAKSTGNRLLEARVARAIPAVERQTGLKFKQQPRVEVRTPAEVRAFLERAFTQSRAARELAGQERAYKLFGLVPPALDVRKMLLDLLEEQVAGFYDPKSKTLYVVKGSSAPAEAVGVTIAHELVHALQDQYVNLDSIQNADVDNDRSTAVQAAIEGHATYISLLNVAGPAGVAKLPGGWAGVTASVRAASADAPGLGAAPAAIREALIFPYTGGLDFIARNYPSHPGVALLLDPPQSTEQVLHAAAYDSGRRDPPVAVTLPPPAGVTRVYENTLGEFETRVFLAQHLRDTVAAAAAARGWAGDRYMIVNTPEGEGIVWLTVWDSPAEAARFRAALSRATAARFGAAGHSGDDAADTAGRRSFAGGNGSSGARSSGRRPAIDLGEVQGRPVVWYQDLPAESPLSALDYRGATLR